MIDILKRPEPCGGCDAAPVAFDERAAAGISAAEVRKRWPRVVHNCTICGAQTIRYASYAHYLAGDW